MSDTTKYQKQTFSGDFLSEIKYSTVGKDGVMVVIINKRKILLLKRIWLPFISHPGMWSFVSGKKEKNEEYLDTAYRETEEETGLEARKLKLLKETDITVRDEKRLVKWKNRLFLFRSDTDSIRLNIENSRYKWVRFEELISGETITSAFQNKERILKLIKYYSGRL